MMIAKIGIGIILALWIGIFVLLAVSPLLVEWGKRQGVCK